MAAAVMATSAFAGVSTLYGIGQIPGWGNFANGSVGEALTQTSDGVFEWEGSVEATAYFGFASELGSWDAINSHRFSPTVKDALAVVGDNAMVANVDASWKINPGVYKFVINTNTMVFTVVETQAVEKVITYAIHGQLDGLEDTDWATYQLEADGDLWKATLTPTVAGGEFGVIQQINGSQSDWYSAGVIFDETESSFVLNCTPAGNCVFDFAAGEAYDFVFDPAASKLTITKTAGVAEVNAEVSDEAPVYYNLQGIRVANPENGLFIVNRGGKISKEIIR